jgi:hypothetical protein
MSGIGPLRRTNFEDFEYTDQELVPLWSIKDIDDNAKLGAVEKWFDKTVDVCQRYYGNHFLTQMDNLLLYKGIQWLSPDRGQNRQLDGINYAQNRSPRVVVNHLGDFVTQWVSRLTRYRPTVGIYPARADESDADDAKIAKNVLDYIWYLNDIDAVTQEFARHLKIFGEAYCWIRWDKNAGPISPIAIQAGDKKVPLLDSKGQPVKSAEGDPMYIDKKIHIGEIEYDVEAPWHVFDMPCHKRKDIDWSIRWSLVDVNVLKAQYPDQADDIKASQETSSIYSAYRFDAGRFKNSCVVYELYHRSSEFLDKGRYIKRIKGCILENMDLPYDHGQIPYVYMGDIEVPDQIRGTSFFQQLFPIQHQINAVSSLIYKALVLFSHPKYTIQEGSSDIQQFLNESTIISYSGGVAPTLLTQSPVAPALFKYLDKLEATAEKLSGVFTMSRGQAPSGVRAAKALRVLEEQEDKRAYITAVRYNDVAIVGNAKKTLATAGQYYDKKDGRLAQIVGKDNTYKMITFDPESLAKPFNVRIENNTALSQSPSGRIDDITELMNIRADPQSLLTREQSIKLLNLTASDEFKDIVTRAVDCAQSENDDFQAGRPVPDPAPFEDLINHWKIHLQPMQSRDYKEIMSPERKAAHEKHVYTTEYLMFEKAYGIVQPDPLTGMPVILKIGNPAFQQRLLVECPNFPVLFEMPAPGQPGPGPLGPTNLTSGGPMPIATSVIQPAPINNGAPIDPGAPTGPPPLQQG